MTTPTVAPSTPTLMPVSWLAPDPENARRTYDEAGLKSLAASLAAVGMVQPIVARPAEKGEKAAGMYVVIAGHRRLKAAQLAKLKDVPVVVRQVAAVEAHKAQFAENRDREALTPLEEAQGIARHLAQTKITQEQLATELGVVPSVISDAVTLACLPEKAQQLFTGPDRLTAAHARELARLRAYPEALEARVKRLKEDLRYHEVPNTKDLRRNVDWDLQELAARDKVEKEKVAEAKKAAAAKDKAKSDKKAQARAAAEREKAKRQKDAEARAAERAEQLEAAIGELLDERTPRYLEAVLEVRKGIKLPEVMLLHFAGELNYDRPGGRTDWEEQLEDRLLERLPGITKGGRLKDKDPKGALSLVALTAWLCGLDKAFDQELEAVAKKRLEAKTAAPAKKGGRK